MNRSIPKLEERAITSDWKRALAKINVLALAFEFTEKKEIKFHLSQSEIKSLEKYLKLNIKELLLLHGKEALSSHEKSENSQLDPITAPLAPIKEVLQLESILFFSQVSEKEINPESVKRIRKIGSTLGRKFKGKNKAILIIGQKSPYFLESLLISNYSWSAKSDEKSDNPHFFIAEVDKSQLQKSEVIIRYLWSARDLIHTPSNIKSPAWVSSQVSAKAKKLTSVKIKVKAGSELKKFGGLLAVGQSSKIHPPRFVEISYSPRGAKKHVLLLGKGITFDTGGVSLKRPYDAMVGMKSDMAGAATVAMATLAAAELKLPVKVTALLLLAENSLSASAQRPSDVITHYGGRTVEVINTDAEGRLVLADGLAYADLHFDPDFIIDLATLTGAASLGLGKQYGAMYTRNDKWAKQLHEIGELAGDRLWRMPLIDDYQPALASDVADFNHTADKEKFGAGSVTAALFLEKFAGKRNWMHLDIAGPARSEVDAGEFVKGGTGFGVRTLISWLEKVK